MLSKRTNQQKIWIKKHLIIIGVSFTLIILIIDLMPIGGNLRFYTKWIQCGNKPLSSDVEWHTGGSPEYYTQSPAYPTIREGAKFYCTPHDAEMAGYSANSDTHSFPHLNEEETKQVYLMIWPD